jgi:hypothetical protein
VVADDARSDPLHDFAARVVKDTLGSQPPAQVWAGNGVWSCWIATWFWHTGQVSTGLDRTQAPKSRLTRCKLQDGILASMFGLKAIASRLAGK